MFHICSHINMSNEDEPDQPPQYDPMDVCPRNTRRHDALDPPPRPVSEDHLAFMEGEAQRIAAHDFSAGDFDWVPVPRRRHNADGWTVARQQAFIRLLADTGSVDRAAFEVGMTPHSCYRLRRQPGAEGFARAWAAAIEAATDRLMDSAMERVLYGTPKRVCDGDGRLHHTEYVYNDRLLMFMLRAHRPERYARADARVLARDDLASPASAPEVEGAIAAIAPTPPAGVQFQDPNLLADMVLNHAPEPDEVAEMMEAEPANPASQAASGCNPN
jgi:hypothetical protein